MFIPVSDEKILCQILGISQQMSADYKQFDLELWNLCYEAMQLKQFSGKELSFIDLGMLLSRDLQSSSRQVLGMLSSASSCSFVTAMYADDIRRQFGHYGLNDSEIHNFLSEYPRVRFAETYWFNVQKTAILDSVESAVSFFSLPRDIVEMVAGATTGNIMGFCRAQPQLQQFRLTCSVDDVRDLIHWFKREGVSGQEWNLRLRLMQSLKYSHSTAFEIIPETREVA